MRNPDLTCWVITDGRAGAENQCLGLAEAVVDLPVVKLVRLRHPWRELAPYFRLGRRFALSRGSSSLSPDWPDLLITAGRQTVLPSLWICEQSGGHTFSVYIQEPGVAAHHFDLVVVPAHDRLRGPNVLVTQGALHRVTQDKLDQAARCFAERLRDIPQPRVAVLIGGDSSSYTFPPAQARRLALQLIQLHRDSGAGLLLTTSRRTSAASKQILQEHMCKVPSFFWDGDAENPYLAFLALAEAIVVTCDSVSMISEACSTGKPVYVFDLPGGSAKFDRFHRNFRHKGRTRLFAGRIESWNCQALDDTEQIAQILSQRLLERVSRREARGQARS